jgi:hypothetical protein
MCMIHRQTAVKMAKMHVSGMAERGGYASFLICISILYIRSFFLILLLGLYLYNCILISIFLLHVNSFFLLNERLK